MTDGEPALGADFRRYCDRLTEELLLVDGEGKIRSANRALLKTLGYSLSDLSERCIEDLASQPPSELRDYLRLCRRSRQWVPGALYLTAASGEVQAFRSDGATVASNGCEVLLRLQPKRSSAGRFLTLTEQIDRLNREIESRRRTEAELEHQRRLLEVTLESIADGVVTTDELGRVTFVNSAAADLIGSTAAAADGELLPSLVRFQTENGGGGVGEALAVVLEKGEEVRASGVLEATAAGGPEVPVEVSAAPIQGVGERPRGMILVLRDRTARQRFEEERRRVLAQEREARRLAEVADNVKDEFLASLSHELRAPLNTLTTWIELLQQQPIDDPRVEKGLGVMERTVQRQSALVEELLDFSLLVAGDVTVKLEPLALNEILTELCDAGREALTERGIKLSLSLEERVGLILADRMRLRQVLHQLLDNAAKFTPSGGQIFVRSSVADDRIEVEIRDTGAGVAADVLASIFDHFRQEDSSRSRRYGGLGLGLAIVRRLVELQHGTIEARSEGAGRGATFTLTLVPFDPDCPDAAEAAGDGGRGRPEP